MDKRALRERDVCSTFIARYDELQQAREGDVPETSLAGLDDARRRLLETMLHEPLAPAEDLAAEKRVRAVAHG